MASTQPRAIQVEMINPVGGVFVSGDKLRLFQAPTVVGSGTKLSDLTEATFVGYAAVSIDPANFSFGLDPLGNAIAKYGAVCSFSAALILATEVENGWYITDTTGATLKALANFDTPVTFANEDDELLMQFFVTTLFGGDADTEFVFGP